MAIEPTDLENSLSKVCKAAFCEENLARGLNESCQAIESTYEAGARAALCLLAADNKDAEYKKLITALCKTHNVPLQTVDTERKLAIFAGLCRFDKEGNAKKVSKKCGTIVIKRFPQAESAAVDAIKQHYNLKN